jgi:hypothetical protein
MGLDWLKSDEAVHKLERMIWGLEVLRTFDDSLSSSLSEIKEARDRMLQIIEQVLEVKTSPLTFKDVLTRSLIKGAWRTPRSP